MKRLGKGSVEPENLNKSTEDLNLEVSLLSLDFKVSGYYFKTVVFKKNSYDVFSSTSDQVADHVSRFSSQSHDTGVLRGPAEDIFH